MPFVLSIPSFTHFGRTKDNIKCGFIFVIFRGQRHQEEPPSHAPSSNVSNSPSTSDKLNIFYLLSFSSYMAAKKNAVGPTKRKREIGGKLILIDEVVGLNIIMSRRLALLLLQGVRGGDEIAFCSHCVMTCSRRSSYFIYYIDKRWSRRREREGK